MLSRIKCDHFIQILESCCSGNENSQQQLWLMTKGYVRSCVRREGDSLSYDESEDIVQVLAIKLFKDDCKTLSRIVQIIPDEKYAISTYFGYIKTIIKNLANNVYAGRKKHEYVDTLDEIDDIISDKFDQYVDNGSDDKLSENEGNFTLRRVPQYYLKKYIQQAFSDCLNEREHKIITFSEIEGYNHREIAEKLGIPTGTVSSIISRGLKKLKEHIIKKYPEIVVNNCKKY